MSDSIDDGGPAFPSHPDSAYAGMTLRDWFAGQVIAAWSVSDTRDGPFHNDEDETLLSFAKGSYRVADAMCKARGQ